MKVETKGSFFWIDEHAGEYMRLPKHEAPRERPEWGSVDAGVLQDAVWHPMNAWRIGHFPDPEGFHRCSDCPGLLIEYGEPSDPASTLWAPRAKVVFR